MTTKMNFDAGRADVRAVGMSNIGNCPGAHARLSISGMESRPHGGHLRVQRRVAGVSVRDLAAAMRVSPTRVRSIEGALRVTDASAGRYLDSLRAAWDRRAADALAEEHIA